MNWDFLIQNKESLLVSTDTRNLPAGCVFFALHGANFDGNRFAAQALEQGASLVVIDDPEVYNTHIQSPISDIRYPLGGTPSNTRIILVEDTLLALQDLAREWRRYLGLPIVAVTGTNGKTTTKELLATVLSTKYNLHYTQGNLNNQIGVPLTLLQLTKAHELAIVEMGASHPGDIKELVDIAEPNYGLITNVGRAHLEGFGSFEGVQRTKQELYDYLVAHDGLIFRNTDNPYLAAMHQSALPISNSPSGASHSSHGERPVGLCPSGNYVAYTTGVMPSGTHLVGSYNAENVSAALCVGEYFGVERTKGLEAIRGYVPTNNRSQALKTANNELVVDAYNANPTSMQAAISVFKGNVFILGAMRELGDYTHFEHQNVVNMLAERKADIVYLVGKEWRLTTAPYMIFDTVEDLRAYLEEHPLKGSSILLKGSRSTKMETLLELL